MNHVQIDSRLIVMNISNSKDIFFAILYTCIFYNLPMNPVKFGHDQIQNGWLNCHCCLLKLANYLKTLSIRMYIFFGDTIHMHILQSSHESCEVWSWSNSKWLTYCHCCLLKLTKYLKTLSVRMNISNTNEYFFCDTLHMHILQSSHESCEVWSWLNSKWSTYCHCWLLKLAKYLETLSVLMNISNTNEYSLQKFTHAYSTILPWMQWSLVMIKFKMFNLLSLQ